MKKIFVCSPYRGNRQDPNGTQLITNRTKAEKICQEIANKGMIPIAPHVYFPRFLRDDYPAEREQGLKMSLELLKGCDEMIVYGPEISHGMGLEIHEAIKLGIPIRFFKFDDVAIELKLIRPATKKELPTWESIAA